MLKAWIVPRYIVRERRVWDALKLISLIGLLIGLFVLKVFEGDIVDHAPSAWWFYVLLGSALVAFLALLEWLHWRFDL